MSCNDVIEIDGVSKCYDIYERPIDRLLSFCKLGNKKQFWALKNISFSVKKGETVAIIGQNGSGKSTLLQCICGTLQTTNGVAQVNGRIAALLELGAGFDPESTGRENVYINGMLLGMSRNEITARFSAIEEFADIGAFIDQPVKTYSSGMYVRLAFAVIANSDPDVLIVDEALAVGDVYFVQKCMRFIRNFKEKGTILFVSHDTAAVTSMCDRAVWLHEGQVRMVGDAKEVSERYLAYQHSKDRMQQTGEDIRFTSAKKSTNSKIELIIPDEDCRQLEFNHSSLRNDIKIVSLGDFDSGFGTGKAEIYEICFESNNLPVRTIVGGEMVKLSIKVKVNDDLDEVIAGFYFKDRLGQKLFGDNTYISYAKKPVNVKGSEKIKAEFEFRMPLLPIGDYSIDVAFANGNQTNHTQHHWIHDAVVFRASASGVSTGLVGIPMKNINLVVE